MKAKLIKLLEYITKHNITVTKSSKGHGMNCYKLEQIETHKDAITTLATSCEWQLKYFKSKYNPKTEQMSTALYYIGPKVVNELDNEDIMSFAD